MHPAALGFTECRPGWLVAFFGTGGWVETGLEMTRNDWGIKESSFIVTNSDK